MTRVLPCDVPAAGYCLPAVRTNYKQWGFSRDDLKRFLRDGMDATELEHIDDITIKRVIEAAEKREAAQ